jgi:tripartite-type tricarboxylate transporter receptor subunit TctC
VVPYPSGGFGDSMSRLLTQKMTERLKQTVIVDNRPGAAAQIAATFVKQQPADGHTLFYGDIGLFAMNSALYTKLSYDTLKDFAPLTRLFNTPLLLVVPAASPLNSFADLVRVASADPALNYGSYGIGSNPHIWTEMLKKRINGRLNHIPYKGAAPALQDLLGGRLDFMCDVTPSSLPLVREGKLKALALIGSDRRLSALPSLPTITELGHPPLNASGWNGVMVKAGTPPAVVATLHAAVVAALQSPDVVQRYSELGLAVAAQSPAQFGEFITAETSRWGAAIREAGVTIG